jgi:hypothetical protein
MWNAHSPAFPRRREGRASERSGQGGSPGGRGPLWGGTLTASTDADNQPTTREGGRGGGPRRGGLGNRIESDDDAIPHEVRGFAGAEQPLVGRSCAEAWRGSECHSGGSRGHGGACGSAQRRGDLVLRRVETRSESDAQSGGALDCRIGRRHGPGCHPNGASALDAADDAADPASSTATHTGWATARPARGLRAVIALHLVRRRTSRVEWGLNRLDHCAAPRIGASPHSMTGCSNPSSEGTDRTLWQEVTVSSCAIRGATTTASIWAKETSWSTAARARIACRSDESRLADSVDEGPCSSGATRRVRCWIRTRRCASHGRGSESSGTTCSTTTASTSRTGARPGVTEARRRIV